MPSQCLQDELKAEQMPLVAASWQAIWLSFSLGVEVARLDQQDEIWPDVWPGVEQLVELLLVDGQPVPLALLRVQLQAALRPVCSGATASRDAAFAHADGQLKRTAPTARLASFEPKWLQNGGCELSLCCLDLFGLGGGRWCCSNGLGGGGLWLRNVPWVGMG